MSVNPVEPRPRYKPYRQYKDSGVEWLGEIPVHGRLGWDSSLMRTPQSGSDLASVHSGGHALFENRPLRPRARPRAPGPADGQYQDDERERRSPAAPAAL